VNDASKTRVLVVEDEHDIAGLIKHTLERGGDMEVESVASGDAALAAVTDRPPDLIILDLNLPVLGGLEVCRILRARPTTAGTPIIMLTARTSESDRVTGLDVGADDYVTKPFSVRELLGRVRAQLRRRALDRSPVAEAIRIEAGPVSIDLVRHLVSVRGQQVNLTRSEFQLLRLLAERPGEVMGRHQIMEELWQSEFDGDARACDVHISNLRQKIERDAQQPELVLTVRGVGYKFNDSAPA
jgi:two-component system, OmpR family, response regulator RegX3